LLRERKVIYRDKYGKPTYERWIPAPEDLNSANEVNLDEKANAVLTMISNCP